MDTLKMEKVVGTCVATWFYGENRVGRSIVRKKGKWTYWNGRGKQKEILLSWLLETNDEDMD